MTYRFSAPAWVWDSGQGPWWFLTVPPDESDELAEEPLPPRGFGSIKVTVTVGRTTWSTSVFPSKEQEGYILPLKKSVRAAEGIVRGGMVDVVLDPVR